MSRVPRAYHRDTRPRRPPWLSLSSRSSLIKDRSTENYDFVSEKIGTGPFDGLIVHTAGFDEEAGVFRILDIWESKEQAQQFLEEHVQPLIDQGPDAFPNPGAFYSANS